MIFIWEYNLQFLVLTFFMDSSSPQKVIFTIYLVIPYSLCTGQLCWSWRNLSFALCFVVQRGGKPTVVVVVVCLCIFCFITGKFYTFQLFQKVYRQPNVTHEISLHCVVISFYIQFSLHLVVMICNRASELCMH